MKRRYIVVLIVMIVCILSTIKFTYGRFTYENTVTGTVTTTSRNPFNVGTLAYSIVDNAMNGNVENQEKTIYSETPLTKPAEQINEENERTLSVTQDDLGNSYYYRGNVKDNYIDFNNMCWRIVRIEGDGAIKLILEDKTQPCKDAIGGENADIGSGTYGYKGEGTKDNPRLADYENCTKDSKTCMKKQFDKWLDENKFDKSLLKEDIWNLGDNRLYNRAQELLENNISCTVSVSACYYENMKRVSLETNVTLKTTDTSIMIKDYIGTLTIDEAALIGLKAYNGNENNNYLANSREFYLLSLARYFGEYSEKPSLAYSDTIGVINTSEKFITNLIVNSYAATFYLRPSIVLKKDIKLLSGDGTKGNAYKIDENPFDEGTLAYEIVKNAQNVRDNKEIIAVNSDTNTTKLSPMPETIPAQDASSENERTLSITEDTLGQSYYFRGNIEDNYLNFNNMCWRIVRIEGDGSIKLILEDKEHTCETATGGDNAFIEGSTYGYKTEDNIKKFDYINCTDDNDSCMKNRLEKWFEEKFKDKKDNLKEDTWYIGNTNNLLDNNYYQSGSRLMNDKNATLKETENDFNSYISTLTADEVAFAGAMVTVESGHGNENCYLHLNSYWWRTLTPLYQTSNTENGTFDATFCVYPGTFVANCAVWNYSSIRPSIVLNNNIKYINGNGTKTTPYIID